MNRNQKLALGCGGAGCLGLIVVAVAGVLIYHFYAGYRSASDRIANYNYNRNTNLNSNANGTAANSNNSSSPSSSSSTTAELTEDEKHRLFQAAAITGDTQLQRRVWVKIGIVNDDFTQGDKFAEFTGAHIGWLVRNYQWVASMDTAEKARAYVDEHLRD